MANNDRARAHTMCSIGGNYGGKLRTKRLTMSTLDTVAS